MGGIRTAEERAIMFGQTAGGGGGAIAFVLLLAPA
jgi:hypothetical protein